MFSFVFTVNVILSFSTIHCTKVQKVILSCNQVLNDDAVVASADDDNVTITDSLL